MLQFFVILGIEVPDILVVYRHDILQGVFEPFVWIDFMFFADSKEGINSGSSLCCVMRSGKEVILDVQELFDLPEEDLYLPAGFIKFAYCVCYPRLLIGDKVNLLLYSSQGRYFQTKKMRFEKV